MFKQNKVLIFVLIVIIAGVILGGSRFSEKKKEKSVALTKVSVALDWFPYSAHTGLFIAKDRGYFKNEGLDVNIVTPADLSTVLQTVASGRDDFGISVPPDLLIAQTKDLPVVSIMALAQHPLDSVITLVESGISQPRDLLGKKVGVTGNAYVDVLLDAMLKHDGVARGIKDVERVNVGFDLVPALIGKKVDAIAGALWIVETISAENKGFPVNVMKVNKWGVPDYYSLVIVTSEKKIKENKDLVQRFVRATMRGYQDAITDPQGAVKLMKKLKPEVDLALESKSVDLLAPLWKSENGVFGWQEESRWENFAKWMKENNLLQKDVDVKSALNNSFVENAGKSK